MAARIMAGMYGELRGLKGRAAAGSGLGPALSPFSSYSMIPTRKGR
jgi:hypothetical protein